MSARAPRLSEAAEDYPRVIARLSDQWRVILCPQGLQWIPQRRDPGGSRWRNAGYFTSAYWLRVFCARLVSDPAAWRALESLPEHVSGARRTRPQRRKAVSGSRVPEKASAALASDGVAP